MPSFSIYSDPNYIIERSVNLSIRKGILIQDNYFSHQQATITNLELILDESTRRQNIIKYPAANLFNQGLRNKLEYSNIRVVDVCVGKSLLCTNLIQKK